MEFTRDNKLSEEVMENVNEVQRVLLEPLNDEIRALKDKYNEVIGLLLINEEPETRGKDIIELAEITSEIIAKHRMKKVLSIGVYKIAQNPTIYKAYQLVDREVVVLPRKVTGTEIKGFIIKVVDLDARRDYIGNSK